jgi:hypothetical protein
MFENIKKAQMRAAESQHGDGTIDLTFGSVFLLAALCFLGVYKMGGSQTYFSTKVLPVLTVVVFVGGGILIDTLVKWFKKHVTVQRTRSMMPRKLSPLTRVGRMVIWYGIPALTGLVLAAIFIFRAHFQSANQDAPNVLLPVFWGMLFGVMWFAAAKRVGLNHFYLMAAVSVVVSAMLFVSGAAGIEAMMVLFAAVGAALCISGLVLMGHFLRNTGMSGEAAPEN